MTFTSPLSLALVAAVSVSPVCAQQAAPAPAAASAASPPGTDCGKSTMKRHDHGADRNTRSTAGATTMPCQAADAASAPHKTTKRKPAHDHAKFHKNQ